MKITYICLPCYHHQGWLDHEVEILVSVREAKHHLAALLNDRKVISQELATLEQKEQDEPPSKVNN